MSTVSEGTIKISKRQNRYGHEFHAEACGVEAVSGKLDAALVSLVEALYQKRRKLCELPEDMLSEKAVKEKLELLRFLGST